MPPLNPYSEVTLYTSSPQCREKWDNCANLYSLLLSLDALERAYISQSITENQYAPNCTRLLAQVKTSGRLVVAAAASANGTTTNGSSVAYQEEGDDPPRVKDLEEFMTLWRLDLPLTTHRLSLGIPATQEHPTSHHGGSTSSPSPHHSSGGNAGGSSNMALHSKNIAETTQAFITLMDALKLNLRAKDQLHPLLGEAVGCWNRSGGGGGEETVDGEEGGRRGKLIGWLITLNQLKASDEIDEDQARQMLFDVEGAYQAWFRSLQGQ